MKVNHRYLLRVSTNIALFIFLCFSLGVSLWLADEFLGWNLLPNQIDAYAQLIVVACGFATGLAVATSFLCGFALLAESAAKRAEVEDYQTPRNVWKFSGVIVVIGVIALFVLNRIDVYRKQIAEEENRAEYREEFFGRVEELNLALPGIVSLFPPELATTTVSENNASEIDSALIRFLSAVRSSTVSRPDVSFLVRAAEPYQYSLLKLRENSNYERDSNISRYRIEKQFYIGFPTQLESELIDRLFSGTVEPLEARLEGEIIDNGFAGTWGIVRFDEEVTGLLILRSSPSPRYDFFHAGPAIASGIPTAFQLIEPE